MSEPSVDTLEELEQNAAMLEQILEVMPDDLFTMRALFEASLKLQKPEMAFETLQRLDDLSCSKQNVEMMDYVLAQYVSIAADDSDIQLRIERLEAVKTEMAQVEESPEPVEEAPVEKSSGSRLEAEMALAWDLFQQEHLTQEEYSNVLHDLTEMSANKMGVPVTVLHILHDRQFSRIERLMSYLCQKSETPIVALSQFEGNEAVYRMLPVEFISANGAMPFAEVGGDLLLAVLNPQDKELRVEAEQLSGRRCHPYLVGPDEYDRQLEKIKKLDG